MTIFILKLFAIYTIGSIALGLIIARYMRFGLHYKPPLPDAELERMERAFRIYDGKRVNS